MAIPPLPRPDAEGNVPAVEYARASLARKIIQARRAAGWSQAELARRAGVRPETLNRIERGRNTPDTATICEDQPCVGEGVTTPPLHIFRYLRMSSYTPPWFEYRA